MQLTHAKMARLTCYGGAGNTTGANFMLEVEGAGPQPTRILIDCGMQQGGERAHEHNQKRFAYDPASVSHLFVTHAHIDHVGLIPKLVKAGFKGDIWSTKETKELGLLLLEDAAKIGADKGEPLYGTADIAQAMALWKTVAYHERKEFADFSVEAFDAGHVLGSSMYKFTTSKGAMLFTGDIGNSPSLLLKNVEPVPGLDYLLMESVYGDRKHEGRAERVEKFTRIVQDAIKRGGALLIPAFSLERTQEILDLLDDMFEKKHLPSAPVFLDSPLALKITAIFEEAQGRDHFNFKELTKTARVADSREIAQTPNPKIIIAGSGMSTAGRILGHEKHYLPDPRSTLLFMGYQAAGTMGRQIAEGVKHVRIDGAQIPVRAQIEKIEGFSGHADSDALVSFVEASAPTLKKVFVAMGEPASEIFLAQRLRDELNVDALATEEGKSYDIDL
jgi:metallo-beta-lactamase family protein